MLIFWHLLKLGPSYRTMYLFSIVHIKMTTNGGFKQYTLKYIHTVKIGWTSDTCLIELKSMRPRIIFLSGGSKGECASSSFHKLLSSLTMTSFFILRIAAQHSVIILYNCISPFLLIFRTLIIVLCATSTPI